MTSQQRYQKLKAFLESKPPNTSERILELLRGQQQSNGSMRWYVRPDAPQRLELHCEVDDDIRRFEGLDENRLGAGFRFLEYVCRDCGEFKKTYSLLTVLKSEDSDKPTAEIMKLGEYPPFGAPVSARIQKLLSKDDLELYRKGLRSEAQGLGIGAATYFRRIVDRHWKLLVTKLRDAAEKLGHADLAVFDKALQETQFSAAVEMLKTAIPDKLLILSGENPLTLLYSPLSVQLHGLTDEACLQQAADIRTVLKALLENIADVLKGQDELKSAAIRLKQIKRSE